MDVYFCIIEVEIYATKTEHEYHHQRLQQQTHKNNNNNNKRKKFHFSISPFLFHRIDSFHFHEFATNDAYWIHSR